MKPPRSFGLFLVRPIQNLFDSACSGIEQGAYMLRDHRPVLGDEVAKKTHTGGRLLEDFVYFHQEPEDNVSLAFMNSS